jgi:hypothetical protein
VTTDALAMGYLTTSLHWLFACLHLVLVTTLARGAVSAEAP